MKCAFCNGEMISKHVTHTADLGTCVAVVKNVPAHACSDCGNGWYSGDVAARLEELFARVENATVAGIVILDYAV